jgi:hypothetical protein
MPRRKPTLRRTQSLQMNLMLHPEKKKRLEILDLYVSKRIYGSKNWKIFFQLLQAILTGVYIPIH